MALKKILGLKCLVKREPGSGPKHFSLSETKAQWELIGWAIVRRRRRRLSSVNTFKHL